MTELHNVFADDWDDLYHPIEGWRFNVMRLVPRGNQLGLSLYELFPRQAQPLYHFHHGIDELLLVVRGRRSSPGDQPQRRAGALRHRILVREPGDRRIVRQRQGRGSVTHRFTARRPALDDPLPRRRG